MLLENPDARPSEHARFLKMCGVDERRSRLHTGGIDLHVIFPPQWSPFQPFLSTPSLKAYLQQRGHRVVQSDWNVGFYNYFISEARLSQAVHRLRRYVVELDDRYAAYRGRAVHALAILQDYSSYHRCVQSLREPGLIDDLSAFKEAVDAFQQLLDAFSTAEPVVTIGTSSLSTGSVLNSPEALDAFVEDATENPFLAYFNSRIGGTDTPRYFGLSIIGGEQLVPGLTLCRLLKQRYPEVPIVVGGSVFSRLIEKDKSLVRLFGRYFDYVCRYEGEQPMDAFLASADPRRDRTPNMAFADGGAIAMTPLCEPLQMNDVPTPDFDGMPLDEYLSPQIVLPLLTTRGCYWGKCAFCYHGMIYQDRYRMRDPKLVAQDVERLSDRYRVFHFAFNDEALPPKLFRLLPDAIPAHKYFFTALYKFEKYFDGRDYQRMFDLGFRSLYIGLETASERVQAHMRKNNLQSTMISNLRGAHDAGIWNHTFVFFGFPTETEAEANETIAFMLDHADVIHSEGTGTFSFEHNAPIHHDPQSYGVAAVMEKPARYLELYYDYRPTTGLDADQAGAMLARFSEAKKALGLYRDGRWMPREYLLLLLGRHRRDELRDKLAVLEVPEMPSRIGEAFAWVTAGTTPPANRRFFVVNKVLHQVYETNEDAVMLLSIVDRAMPVAELLSAYPTMKRLLVESEFPAQVPA